MVFKCPHCQSYNIRFTKTSVKHHWINDKNGERQILAKRTLIERYRCDDCGRKFEEKLEANV